MLSDLIIAGLLLLLGCGVVYGYRKKYYGGVTVVGALSLLVVMLVLVLLLFLQNGTL
jgi:LPXTG-motif cell wall-anchored protein